MQVRMEKTFPEGQPHFSICGFKVMSLFQETDLKTAAHLLPPSLPGGQKLNELVCLLVCFSSCVHILYLLRHLREVPTAASQTDAGGGGAGAQPRVWHW